VIQLETILRSEVQYLQMTDVQLYLAAGIPTFAVLVGILTNIVHHSAVNARFNAVDTRISNLEMRMDARFNNVDARFNNLDVKFDTLTGKVIELDNRVTRIEAKLGIN
jgi:hypothetical protein